MSRENNLLKNTFIIGLGTFLPKICSFIILPILTAYVSKVDYGNLDIITTLATLLLPMSSLKIEAAAFRFIIEKRGDDSEITKIVSTICFFYFGVSTIVLILYYFLPIQFNNEIKLLTCIYFFVLSFLSLIQQVLRGLSQNMLYAISCILNSFLNMIFIVIFIYVYKMGIVGVLYSYIISATITVVIILKYGKLVRYICYNKVSFNWLKQMLGYSWPMVPNSLSLWVMNLSDRLLISLYIGAEANAVYAVSNKIPSLYSSLEGTFTMAWQENASLAVKDKDTENYYSKIFEGYFDILILLMSGIIAITPFIFKLLIKGNYLEAYIQMPILFFAMFFSSLSSFFGGIYVAHKKTRSVGCTTITAAVINVVINILLIKYIGIFAASFSTLFSYIFLALYRMKDVLKYQKIKYNWKRLILGILGLVSLCVMMLIDNMYGYVCVFVWAIVFTLIYNKKMLTEICDIMLKKIVKKR